MKKTIFLALTCLVMTTVISCNQDRDLNEPAHMDSNMGSALSNRADSEESRSLIPININKVGNEYHILFDDDNSLYILLDTPQNASYLNKIQGAIGEKALLITSNNYTITNVQDSHAAYVTQPICNEVGYNNLSGVSSLETVDKLADILSKRSEYVSIGVKSINNNQYVSNGLPNFKFRINGCHARAHRMRQLLMYKGYGCEKIWLFGRLRAITERGTVINWGWHVAIALTLPNGQKRVIDPAFQKKSMTVSDWEAKCLDATGLPRGYHPPYKIASAFTTESSCYTLANVSKRGNSVNITRQYDNCYIQTTNLLKEYNNRKD
ncbi:protein-glutamine glutaminase family protein [Chryseobacterium fistulae]|uniref:Protein glutaminase domain-containing protein n=1 Tax=Chryseobacterium fistulae TaxID=2675058 RepID=A0A6N4XT13_9FLAO|nr:protein-glutamine glutaminase family protein [Chryseobacterium fistulae]CAA7392611.1 hypothetical protein CHRY9393_03336 [Chryseobacterium fistulae]